MTATRIAGAATLVVWIAAAALLWRTEVPDDLRLPDVEVAEVFPAGHLEEAEDYARAQRLLWIGATLASLGAVALVALRPPRRRPLVVLLIALGALWLARLPFGVAAHWWRRRHGISSQGYLDWLVSPWLELLGAVAAAVIALLLAIALERRLGRRWWLAGGPALAALGAAVVLAQPLLWTPRLEPLRDRGLAADISALADELGVDVDRIEVKEASDRTVRANAEVVGLGPTRTVALWDTLLDGRFERGEIRWVAAHELAHVARRHLWKGLAWLALLSVPVAWIVARATQRRGGIGRPAAVPVAVLTVLAVEFALLPFVSTISRRYEAEADWIALETTRDPVAAEGLLRGFSLTGLADPDPPGWSRALLSTHPSLVERIAMARAWASRSRGGPPPAGS
jgi:Zn-dependent protease with chaperone function